MRPNTKLKAPKYDVIVEGNSTSGEVYCKNCAHYCHASFHVAIYMKFTTLCYATTREIKTWYGNTASEGIVNARTRNAKRACKFYTKKWWKFWVS